MKNETLIQLEEEKGFYASLANKSGLRWTVNQFASRNNFDNPVGLYFELKKKVLEMRMCRACVIAFGLIGWYFFLYQLVDYTIGTSLWSVDPDSISAIIIPICLVCMVGAPWGLLIYLILPVTDQMMDALVDRKWTTRGFKATIGIFLNDGIREDPDIPVWMGANGEEGVRFVVPAHVKKRCEARLITLARDISETDAPSADDAAVAGKGYLNDYFKACKALGIINEDERIRRYYDLAKAEIEKAKAD